MKILKVRFVYQCRCGALRLGSGKAPSTAGLPPPLKCGYCGELALLADMGSINMASDGFKVGEWELLDEG